MSSREVGLVILYQRRLHSPTLEELMARLPDNLQVKYGEGGALVSEGGDDEDDGDDEDEDGEERPVVHVRLDLAPGVLTYSMAQAERLAATRKDTAAIARCDGRLVVSWVQGDDISDITLELCYLESDLGGITLFTNIDEVSDASFGPDAPHAAVDAEGRPLDDAALVARLCGSWRLDPREPCDAAAPGAMSATVTASGDLVYSEQRGGSIQRIHLVYRVEGGDLITDQPSKPHVERSPISLAADGRLILADPGGRCVFVREAEDDRLDGDAALSALAGFALRHSVGSVSAGSVMVPFLVSEDTRGARSLVRFVSETPEAARALAEAAAAALGPDVVLCAYAVDGYLREGEGRMDAMIVEASRRGRDGACVIAQKYRVSDGAAAQAVGGNVWMDEQRPRSWFSR